jgi:hypothetical protein
MAEEAMIKADIEALQIMKAIVAAVIVAADTLIVALETIHHMTEAVTLAVIRAQTHGPSATRTRVVEAIAVDMAALIPAADIRALIAATTRAAHASRQAEKITVRTAVAAADKSGAVRTVEDKTTAVHNKTRAVRSRAIADMTNAEVTAASAAEVRRAMDVAVITARTGNNYRSTNGQNISGDSYFLQAHLLFN